MLEACSFIIRLILFVLPRVERTLISRQFRSWKASVENRRMTIEFVYRILRSIFPLPFKRFINRREASAGAIGNDVGELDNATRRANVVSPQR